MAARHEQRVAVDGRTLVISNLDKVLYPRTGTTKGEVLHYYAQVAPVLLPHLADRAVTRIRWPHGVAEGSFFEKNLPTGAPSWLARAQITGHGSRSGTEGGETVTYPVVDGLAALTYLVNLASLELHVHQWRVDVDADGVGAPRTPDRLVVDLDPGPGAGLHQCAQVALMVRQALAEHDLDCVPVTSGSKGLHLYAALPSPTDGTERRTSADVRDLAKQVAQALERERGDLVTSTMTKAKRKEKVFLDWSQNTAAKTTITPYSLRGRDRPLVAAPRTWAEIEEGAEDVMALDQCTWGEVLERVGTYGDLCEPLLP
ncbi:non-homologous end-joining DNA ligase [Nocardioidaceae bacterium]|nr:non-homologous end-joining DNA ligase [Nocardioidaceae bacterium]